MDNFQAEFVDNPTNYEHHFRWKGTNHHKNEGARAWDYKEFISFDGEGIAFNESTAHAMGNVVLHENPEYHKEVIDHEKFGKIIYTKRGVDSVIRDYRPEPQPYVLLGNSKGDRITNKNGLGTIDCLEFLLNSKVKYPDSIFTGFAYNYDTNQILCDLPEHKLIQLHDRGHITWRKYWIRWLPKKSLNVKHRPTGRSMILYDSFGFFQKSFLQTCIDYLGEDDPQLELIQAGKQARELFNWEELDDFIIPYNDAEMTMHVRIMDMLREDLHSVDAVPSRWHGPGAVADKVFTKHHIPISREIPGDVLNASQFAYAGGRFELFQMGRYPYFVYEYDIHSAYPAAAIKLPDLSRGTWEYVTSFQPGTFSIWHCKCGEGDQNWWNNYRPHPLFCRSRQGTISYPHRVEGWYWEPEAALIDPRNVIEGYVFHPATDERPFAFIEEMYNNRRILKSQGSSSERALKLILNSVYGKMAQTVGGKNSPPRWHQLEWAGYITSYTRAKIYQAIMLNPNAIIASETDAVFSTEPLDLPLTDELGDWEETIFDEICYLQSGFYYAIHNGKTICRYRGMDKDRHTGQPQGLPYEKVLETLQGDKLILRSTTTRFVGLGLGLQTKSVWRSWEKREHIIRLYSKGGKRLHNRETCHLCGRKTMHDQLHPLEIGGYSGQSYARALPWRTVEGPGEAPISWEEWKEMDPDVRDLGTDFDRWQ